MMIKEIVEQSDKDYGKKIIAVCDGENCGNEKRMTKRNYKYHTDKHDGSYYCGGCNRDYTANNRKKYSMRNRVWGN